MENNILLSILIPTKDRIDYTLSVTSHILSLSDSRFELVLQDNSSSEFLKLKLIENGLINDNRLCYHYTHGELSFVDNFSKGIENCKGEYVTIIGDDDTINPSIFDIVHWALLNNIDAITPTLPMVYNWPGSGVNTLKKTGYLDVVNFSSRANFYNTRKELQKLLRNGCQNYLDYNLVKLYHGVVRKSRLDEIKTKLGYYIGGLSPDIYLSVALSLIIAKVLVIDYPLTISGICKKSGSADSASGKHTGDLKQAPHFKGHSSYKWSKLIPEFYSVETIWGDSAIAALTDLDERALMKKFSLSAISASCYISYPNYKEVILQNIFNNTNCNGFKAKMILIYGWLQNLCALFKRRINNRIYNRTNLNYFDDVKNIAIAEQLVKPLLIDKERQLMKNLALIKK